jgi:hypothetical protein
VSERTELGATTADAPDIAETGKILIGNVQEHKKEVVRLAHRLSEIIPPGAVVLVAIEKPGPKLALANGMSPAPIFEMVQVVRPAVYLQVNAQAPK